MNFPVRCLLSLSLSPRFAYDCMYQTSQKVVVPSPAFRRRQRLSCRFERRVARCRPRSCRRRHRRRRRSRRHF